MDTAIDIKGLAKRLGYCPSTVRSLLSDGWGQRWGLVELPRIGKRGKRRFSEASVERVVTQGTGIVIKTRNRRAS